MTRKKKKVITLMTFLTFPVNTFPVNSNFVRSLCTKRCLSRLNK